MITFYIKSCFYEKIIVISKGEIFYFLWNIILAVESLKINNVPLTMKNKYLLL